MFSKPKKDSGKSASASAAVAAYDAERPDTALLKARQMFANAMGDAHVSASRSFMLALFFGVFALVEGLALKSMMPLKQTVPYVVNVCSKSGEVGKDAAPAIPAAQYQPELPVLDREIFNFVKDLYAMNADAMPIMVQAQAEGLAYTRDRATAEFKDFLNKEQVYQRMAKTPGLVRTVEKTTINHQSETSMLIRFKSTERTTAAPDGIVRNWVMTVTYTRAQPSDKDELDRNPLGIYITNFEIQEE